MTSNQKIFLGATVLGGTALVLWKKRAAASAMEQRVLDVGDINRPTDAAGVAVSGPLNVDGSFNQDGSGALSTADAGDSLPIGAFAAQATASEIAGNGGG